MNILTELLERNPNLKDKGFALAAHILNRRKHHYMTRAFKMAQVDNVTYLRNAGSVVFCTRCGNELTLIGRTLQDLTFEERYGCSNNPPFDPEDPKGHPYGYELRPAS